jgi:hypothetical protein
MKYTMRASLWANAVLARFAPFTGRAVAQHYMMSALICFNRTVLSSTYRAVIAIDACPINVDTALISAPFSIC